MRNNRGVMALLSELEVPLDYRCYRHGAPIGAAGVWVCRGKSSRSSTCMQASKSATRTLYEVPSTRLTRLGASTTRDRTGILDLICLGQEVPREYSKPREPHGVPHGVLLLYKLNFLSISSNSIFKSSIPPNKIKGFTGLKFDFENKTKGPHGLTGFIPQKPSPTSSSTLSPLEVATPVRSSCQYSVCICVHP